MGLPQCRCGRWCGLCFIPGAIVSLPLEPVAYEEEAGDENELKEASENWKLEIIKNLATWHSF